MARQLDLLSLVLVIFIFGLPIILAGTPTTCDYSTGHGYLIIFQLFYFFVLNILLNEDFYCLLWMMLAHRSQLLILANSNVRTNTT